MRFSSVLALLLVGCAPQLVAVKEQTRGDGVLVSFCGAERQKMKVTGWDLGRIEVCIEVKNESSSEIVVNRDRILLVTTGIRQKRMKDDQEATWPISPHAEESFNVVFKVDKLHRGDELVLSLREAITRGDAPIKVPGLELDYQ